MDIDTLKNLIDSSTILEDADRAYWRSQLPTMNEAQQQKLFGILKAAADIHMEEHVRTYVTLVRANSASSTPSAV